MSTTQMPPNDTHASLRTALTVCRTQQQLCLQAAVYMANQDLHIVSRLLIFIARQEAEQAAYLQLMLPDDSAAPEALPALPQTPEAVLCLLIGREGASAGELLPAAAREALQAGRPRAASALLHIAETDEGHRIRLTGLLHALEDGTLLHSDHAASWFCTGCGGLHNGCDAPQICESCSGSRSHFIRSDFYPLALR